MRNGRRRERAREVKAVDKIEQRRHSISIPLSFWRLMVGRYEVCLLFDLWLWPLSNR